MCSCLEDMIVDKILMKKPILKDFVTQLIEITRVCYRLGQIRLLL